MKKILILANSSAGLYDFRNELIQKLLAENHVVASLPDAVKKKELEEEGVRVVETPINRRGVNPIEDLKLLFAYRKLLKKEKPDLVLTYTIKPNIYGGFCCSRLKIPYVSTVTGLGTTFQKDGLFLKLIVFLYRMGLKKSSCVFFQNKENQQVFQKHGILGKEEKLVNGSGVNLETHPFEPYPEEDFIHFLYVGRMMKEKGIEELLGAAKQLQEEGNQGIRIELLGYCDEDYQERLDEAERAGEIVQLGFDPKVHTHLKRASAVVMPSYHEGMSNVLMEASATGRPVIATRISGCQELFEEGVTGFGCQKESTEDLLRALKAFVKLTYVERKKMGQKARTKMEKEFDRTQIISAYMAIIEQILDIRKESKQ